MKNRSLLSRTACGLLLAASTLALTACGVNYYQFPRYNFAGRPVPPSALSTRVMVAIDNPTAYSGGELQILDASRDLRNNVANTIPGWTISGYSGRLPTTILSFPEQMMGYVYGSGDGSLNKVNYATESSTGGVSGLPSTSDSIATSSTGAQIYAASGAIGGVIVVDNTLSRSYALNLPGAQHVAVNPGGTVALVTVRNTVPGPTTGTQTVFDLYRVVKLNNNVLPPAGSYADCEPLSLPVYCVVPVKGLYDRPTAVVFSLDGGSAYVLNCGPECGGATAGVSILDTTSLNVNTIPTGNDPSPVTATVPVPGGATVGLTDGSNLYVAGQELITTANKNTLFGGQFAPAVGTFTGVLSIVSLGTTPAVTAAYSIPDGTHTSLLFADDNTLWIGSTLCADGARGYLAANVNTTPGAVNMNCLAAYSLGSGVTPSIVPAVSPGNPVGYPNQNNNQYYYGDLTGICWVQFYHKVYTAYGGQVHAFNTGDLSEIDNQYITVQGTASNVVYMDALSNSAN